MKPITNVVILGGGTAGWISAALLNKILGNTVAITLVESEQVGTVGVGEATIPPIQQLNAVLGIDERDFIRETQATIKLAIRFENWKQQGHRYYHTFGAPGKSLPFCYFHHLWLRAKRAGLEKDLWCFDLNYHACEAGRFAKLASQDTSLDMPYAYHFDASLYAQFLRKYAEKNGVTRREGKVQHVNLSSDTGYVESLLLEDGSTVAGDFFIDCSGFRALLIQGYLNTGFEDWTHWLACDRAIAVPSERFECTAPYTRSIAQSAGWQWQIPLQHRNGNGLVYSSSHYTFDQACDVLLASIGSEPLSEPRELTFKTGRARKQWHRNVVSIGLASGFLEPLESTSIHLIQSGIVRLAKLFPHCGVSPSLQAEYNQQSRIEFEQIRDFIILHYFLNQRRDSPFWRDMQTLEIPDSLQHKMDLFKECGAIVREQGDLFAESSWLQVLMGQGIEPLDIHPLAKAMPEVQLQEALQQIYQAKSTPIAKMPRHDEFLAMYTKKASRLEQRIHFA